MIETKNPEKTTETTEAMEATETAVQEVPKPYTFRRLKSEDVFPMFTIIHKIGINEFKSCLSSVGVLKAISSIAKGNAANQEAGVLAAGAEVALDAVNIILGNLPKAEKEVYAFLERISDLSVEELRNLDIAVFAEMIIDLVKKEEFTDFFKVVSKLFK